MTVLLLGCNLRVEVGKHFSVFIGLLDKLFEEDILVHGRRVLLKVIEKIKSFITS